MQKFIDNLKRQAEENPILALGVTAAVATAASKLVHTMSEARNSRTWAKEVDRRRMQSSRR